MESGEPYPPTPGESITEPPTPQWGETVAAPSGAFPPPYAPPPGVASGAQPEPPPPGRMGRGDAMDLLSRLKATLVTGSIVALGIFAALAATHITGVTARAASSSQSSGDSQGTQATPAENSDDGSFFNQSPNGFGIGQPGSQGPASSTSVS